MPTQIDQLVDEYTAWAKRRAALVSGNRDDAEQLLRLLHEHVTLDMEPGDVEELLMEVYPDNATAPRRNPAGVIRAARDVLEFLLATERVEPEWANELHQELDDVEPKFLDFAKDGFGRYTDEDMTLGDVLGIPEQLPPIRLPEPAELAAAARESKLLRRVREVAEWAAGRELTEDGDLREPDAAALGVAAPELAWLWDLAVELELVSVEGTVAASFADRWPSGDDAADLRLWSAGLGQTASSISFDAAVAGEGQLTLDAVAMAPVMLFLARYEGVPRAQLAAVARDNATAELSPEAATKAWDAWVAAHGDPVDTLLERLAEHGAVEFDDQHARFTPLALWAMCVEVNAGGIDMPILPPVDDMSAADLLVAANWMPEDEAAREIADWVAGYGPDAAARELLHAAATAAPGDRIYAMHVVEQLGSVAEPRWRAALDLPELRPYAKLALNKLSGSDVFDLRQDDEGIAWLLTDVLASSDEEFGGEAFDELFREAVPAGQEEAVLGVMWRIPHPDVHEVLTTIGARHPDKSVAKAARKAAFKVSARAR